MALSYTVGASDPNEPLSFADILNALSAACSKAADKLPGHALNFFAAVVGYFRARRDQAHAAEDKAAETGYNQLVSSMSLLTQKIGDGKYTCPDLQTAMYAFLDQLKDDRRDDTYVEMNREIRSFYDQLLIMTGSTDPTVPAPPTPEPPPTAPRRRKGVLVAVAVGTLVAVGGVAYGVHRYRKRRS